MPDKQLHTIRRSLVDKRLYHALLVMHPIINKTGQYELEERWQNLERDYSYLLNYFADGHDDMRRSEMQDSLVAQAWHLYDDMVLQATAHLKPQTRLRMEAEAQRFVAEEEEFSRAKKVFYDAWLKPEVYDVEMPQYSLQMYVSAITLNLLERFDERLLLHLIDLCEQDSLAVRAKALIGAAIVYIKYNERLYVFPQLIERLSMFLSEQQNQQDTLLSLRLLLQTLFTPEANKEIESLQKDVSMTIDRSEGKTHHLFISLDEEQLEANPQWSKKMKKVVKSHIDRMRALHESGADINYSTTLQMLRTPFFQDIANWFMPFDRQNPQIQIDSSTQYGKVIEGMLKAQPTACDVDKYGICSIYQFMNSNMSDDSMPEIVKEMTDEVAELSDDEEEQLNIEDYLLNYVRCLYRFFKNNQWNIPDDTLIFGNMSQTELFRMTCPIKQRVDFADIYIRLENFSAAELLLRQVLELKKLSSTLRVAVYQKLGYVLEKQSKYQSAAQMFEWALLISDEAWTLQHLASCYWHTDDYENALRIYARLLELYPERHSYLFRQAQCLLEAGQTEQALQVFYHILALYDNDINAQRGIGWCSLLLNKKQSAEKYLFEVAESEQATANDIINYAHWLLTQNKRKEAIDYYVKARHKTDKLSDFFRLMRHDYSLLRERGVETTQLTLIEDCLMHLTVQV